MIMSTQGNHSKWVETYRKETEVPVKARLVEKVANK